MSGYSIREMPLAERPRERLLQQGAKALSAAELLAIIIGNGTRGVSALQLGGMLVARFGDLPGLARATVPELCEIKGLGQAKAVQVKAACQLAAFISKEGGEVRPSLNHPLQAVRLLQGSLVEATEERVVVLLKDSRGCLIRQELVAIGTLSETTIHPRELFYHAIRHKAASVILAHNHPSGDPTPSQADRTTTRDLLHAGELLGIPLDDHIIVARNGHVSLREEGDLWPGLTNEHCGQLDL